MRGCAESGIGVSQRAYLSSPAPPLIRRHSPSVKTGVHRRPIAPPSPRFTGRRRFAPDDFGKSLDGAKSKIFRSKIPFVSARPQRDRQAFPNHFQILLWPFRAISMGYEAKNLEMIYRSPSPRTFLDRLCRQCPFGRRPRAVARWRKLYANEGD